MTILQTAYDTVTERGRQLGVIRDAIEFAINARALDAFNAVDRIVYVRGKGTHVDAIPTFMHPLQIDPKDPTYLAVDLRPYLSAEPGAGKQYQIRRPFPYQAQMARTLFTHRWLTKGPESLLHINSSVIAGYANWIKDVFGAKLSIAEGRKTQILAAYYYLCQFYDNTSFTSGEINGLIKLMNRATGIAHHEITEVIIALAKPNGLYDAITDLDMFCKVVQEVTGSPRLRNVTPAVFVPALANSWDGSESKALVATAVEYPPSWMAYFMIALLSRQHQRTRLSQAVHRAVGKQNIGFVAQALVQTIKFDTRSQEGIQPTEEEQVLMHY